ncbi:MAG TPA: glycosyltransferase family 39 protein [bacterium]
MSVRYLAVGLRAPASPARDLLVILAPGLALMLYWLGTTHPQVNVDSVQYLSIARKLVGQGQASTLVNRPPGYPLLMVLTGVTWLDSLRWLIGVQALLGLAIPPLVYLTLRPLGRPAALGAGLAVALTPIPCIYAGMVMSDQLSMFLLALFAYFASRYLTRERPARFLALATVTALAMVLTRPASGLVFWMLFAVAAATGPRRLRAPLTAAALYCAALVAWSGADWLLTGCADALPRGESRAAHRAGLRFEEAYLHTWRQRFEDYGKPRPFIVPANGPSTRVLYQCLWEALRQGPVPQWVSRSSRARLGVRAQDPGALLQEFFLNPNPVFLSYIVDTVKGRMGPAAAEEVFAGVARESGRGGWRGLAANLSLGVSSRMAGLSLLWEAFIAGRHHGGYDAERPFRLVRAENGPATRQLYEALASYGELTGDYDRAAAPAFIERPGAGSLDHVMTATTQVYGPGAADRLMRDVAIEAFRAYPAAVLLFWDNFVVLAAGPGEVHYTADRRSTDLPGPLYLSSGLDRLPETMRREAGGDKPPTPIFDALYRVIHLLRPLLLVACLVLLPFAWAGPARPLAVLLVLLALSQYAVVAVMSQPHGRFSDPVYLLIVMAVAIGAAGVRAGGSGAGAGEAA